MFRGSHTGCVSTARRTRIVSGFLCAAFAGSVIAEDLPGPLAAGWKGQAVCEQIEAGDLQRVVRCSFAPGVGHERHYHRPHFGYVLAGGRMRITDASGTRELDIPTGYSWQSDGVDWHEAVNVGDTTSTYLVVEPRNTQASLTAEEDHARILAMLGIDALRRGADGDPASEHAANYDEQYANSRLDTLPPLLEMDDGTVVADADAWWDRRRAELLAHFRQEVYGKPPPAMPGIHWRIVGQRDELSGDRKVRTLELEGVVDNARHPALDVVIPVTITRPVAAEKAVPVVIELAFGPDVMARLRERFSEAELAAFSGGGPPGREQVLARGWAWASIDATRVQADNGDGLTRGIIGLTNFGRPRALDDWGALRAWAWSAGALVSWFEGQRGYDAERVAVYGHSRFGKAALVAMATDQRLKAAFVSSSGEGGAKLWRRNFGEQVGNIAGAGEYHWVAGNFLKYAGPLDVEDLPVDAHALIALCAPRGVFISSGDNGDQWVDPKGMFLAAREAGVVYELLGGEGLGGTAYPPVGTQVGKGALVYRQHHLGHTPGPNWARFLDFAARRFVTDGS